MRLASSSLVALLLLSGCGSSVEGVYSGKDTGFLDQIELKGDNRAELMFMGTIREGTWEVQDGKVRINNNGDISLLTIDDQGCLDGGNLLGRYCKGGAASSSGSAKSSAGTDSGMDLIGNRFAAGPNGDQWVIEFVDGRQVSMEIDGDTERLGYETRGGRVVVHGQDGTDLVLEPRGNDLEGGPDGMVMLFRRL
ncbi:MAG: hypothetical protein R3E86_06550 [Pseudomonadales bacterium]